VDPQLAPTPSPSGGIDLDALYKAHVEYIWATLRRLGVADADLEDVAHDVFVTVHRRHADIDPERPLRPWLFGIALRMASRYRRTMHRRREVRGDDHAELRDQTRDARGDLEQRDARRVVFLALDRLSDEQRAVFVLHELEGKSVPEIAAEIEVPLNTVYSRLRLARERFTTAVAHARRREPAS
jgi:RNA polymerase sigma-70 factor (ECF subfamily)